MKKYLLLLLLVSLVHGTIITWTGNVSEDWNNASNWNPVSAYPQTVDDTAWFNNDNDSCAASANIFCGKIIVDQTHSGPINFLSYTVQTAYGINDTGSGNRWLGDSIITDSARAVIYLGSTIGTLSTSTTDMLFNDTTILESHKGPTIKSMRIVKKLTTQGTANISIKTSNVPLTMNNGSHLTINRILGIQAEGSDFISLLGTYIIDGASYLIFDNVNTGTKASIPALTTTVSNIWIRGNRGGTGIDTIQLTGNQNHSGSINIYQSSSTVFVFMTNNYTLTTGVLTIGNNSTNTCYQYFGSSTINCSSFNGQSYAGTCNVYFQTSIINVTGDVNLGVLTVDAGTSTINLNTGAASTVNMNGKTVYNVVVNKTGGNTTTFSTYGRLNNLTVSPTNTGPVTWTGTIMEGSGNITVDGTGTLNTGTGVTLTGASSQFHLGSTLGTVTATSCALTMNGTTAMVLDDDKGITINTITLGAAAVVTSTGAAVTTLTGTVTLFTLGNNSTFTMNKRINFVLTGNAAFWSIGAGVTFDGGQAPFAYVGANGITCTMPAVTYTGTGTWVIGDGGSFTNWTIQLTGTLSATTSATHFATANANSTGTYDFNNQNVTVSQFVSGIFAVTNTATFNYGSGTFTVGLFNGSTYNAAGTCNDNFQTSQWTCTGNWTYGSNHTVDSGTSRINIVSGSNSNLTFNKKGLCSLYIDKTSLTTDILDDTLRCVYLDLHGTHTIDFGGCAIFTNGFKIWEGPTAVFGPSIHSNWFFNSNSYTYAKYDTTILFFENRTSNLINYTTGATFKRFTINACTLNVIGNASIGLTDDDTCIIIKNGSTLINSMPLSIYCINNTFPIYQEKNSVFEGPGNIGIAPYNLSTPQTITIGYIKYTGSGTWGIAGRGSENKRTVNFLDTFDIGNNQLSMYNNATDTIYYYFYNIYLKCGVLQIGNFWYGDYAGYNFYKSVFNIKMYNGVPYNGTGVTMVNMDTTLFICDSSWIFGSHSTVDPDRSTVQLTGKGVLSSFNKLFYDIEKITADSTDTIRLTDSLTARRLSINGGVFDMNAKSLFTERLFFLFGFNILNSKLWVKDSLVYTDSTGTDSTGGKIYTITGDTLVFSSRIRGTPSILNRGSMVKYR